MKLPILCQAFLFIASLSHAGTVYLSEDFAGVIPDGSVTGLSRTLELSEPGETITSVTVDFSLTGFEGSPFLGDLYVYLTDGTTLVTLLNRPGRDEGRLDGYNDGFGMNITFSDAALTDAHLYRMEATGDNDTALASPLLGSFQPDGRDTDPLSVITSSLRTSLLSDFIGLSAERSFTLFAADLSSGAQHEIESWGLDVEIIPEPSHALLVLIAGAACFFRRKRRNRGLCLKPAEVPTLTKRGPPAVLNEAISLQPLPLLASPSRSTRSGCATKRKSLSGRQARRCRR